MLRIDRKYVLAAKAATQGSDLHELLQNAIQLEHATIPPYLAAAYSLKPGANSTIRRAIAGIAVEEMLHMAIVANVLNAIGGKPRIDQPDFIPVYPKTLPMSIGSALVVGLRKFSLDLVHDVFMEIEKPEHLIHIPPPPQALVAVAAQFATIGEFYRAMIDKIRELGDSIFIGKPERQVTATAGFPVEQLFAITNAETAVTALDWIVREGEGTATVPFDGENEPAHYYRFEEIYYRRRLKEDATAESGYAYSGASIAFDPAQIWDFPDDAKPADYSAGSAQRDKVDTFNRAYSDVLRSLQRTFDGSPGEIVNARNLMDVLRGVAFEVVATQDPSTDRQLALTFTYLPAA